MHGSSAMKATDASLYPYPVGDTTLARMALEAAELGFDSIVAMGESPGSGSFEVEVLRGIVIKASSQKDLIKQVRRPIARDTDLVFVDAKDRAFNRAAVTVRGVHVIGNIHKARRYAFDHVAARSAAECGTAVEISLSPIIQDRGTRRQRALQQYADILTLKRRYDFPLTISSGAHSVLEQRSVRETRGLCSLFGMTAAEVSDALSSVARLVEPDRPVRVVE